VLPPLLAWLPALLAALAWVVSGTAAGAGGSGDHQHIHPPVPPAYAKVRIPDRVWTDARALALGKTIWLARCAECHGVDGNGKGPAAAGLTLKPADLTDGRMAADMPATYWFWRVSEGGQVEPFKSMGSVMPAWKGALTASERWAVITYAHSLTGHKGPHTPHAHPQGHGGPGTSGSPSGSGKR
jgi:mono/diheme cytochrome c family protein